MVLIFEGESTTLPSDFTTNSLNHFTQHWQHVLCTFLIYFSFMAELATEPLGFCCCLLLRVGTRKFSRRPIL